jgi:hypothetical protein
MRVRVFLRTAAQEPERKSCSLFPCRLVAFGEIFRKCCFSTVGHGFLVSVSS